MPTAAYICIQRGSGHVQQHLPMAKGTAAAAEEEVVIGVPVHCDGCARKLRRSLQRIDGVGEVTVDSRANRVVLRGQKAPEKAAEAVKIVERRTRRKAVLVSPAPEKLPPTAAKGGEEPKKDGGNKDVTNDDLPEIDMKMVVILRINLHCDACCEEIKRRILRIKGVEDAVPHLKSSQMMVKGVVEPATLVGLIRDCTGRKAAIFRAEPLDPLPAPKSPPKDAPPVEADEPKKNDPSEDTGEEKKNGEENENKKEGNKDETGDENPDSNGDGDEEHQGTHGEAPKDAGDGVVLESHKKDDRLFTVPLPAGVVAVAPEVALNGFNPYYHSYPSYPYPNMYQYRYPQPYYPPYACGHAMYGYPHYPPPPEEFCEENPNACAIA